MVATLEIKVNFMTPGRPDPLNGTGSVVHMGISSQANFVRKAVW